MKEIRPRKRKRTLREIYNGMQGDRIVSCHYDSMEYDEMTAKQMYAQLKERLSPEGKTYLFLDEVQEIKGWEKVVNSLVSDFDVDLYVTGSNSRMMSSEISTCLTGRYIAFRIFTLSFAEYLMFKEKYGTVGDLRTEFAKYVRLGGFPATHLQKYSQDEIYTIVRDIYNSTIFSDIVKRNQVRKIDQLERVVKYAFNNVGNTFSGKSISDYLKSEHRTLDNETVYSYLEKLEKAYLLHRCSRYDLQGKEILKTQEKFYLADNALRQNEKLYVQVSQEIISEKTKKQEYSRLLEIHDNYPKYVLGADEFADGNYEGIKTMHIADFLLSSKY